MRIECNVGVENTVFSLLWIFPVPSGTCVDGWEDGLEMERD